jgi:hypothetical protein
MSALSAMLNRHYVWYIGRIIYGMKMSVFFVTIDNQLKIHVESLYPKNTNTLTNPACQ